ncbi:hypothetical protein LguiA_033985 [Lonicera macranthoides]
MALETLTSSNEPFNNFTTYDNISANPLNEFSSNPMGFLQKSSSNSKCEEEEEEGRKKKRRKRGRREFKNREEAETQRMTHIAVERNRRKQMNHHLSVLRSLMPQSYTQRGDQATIVGGAIEFVKELEQLLQSLEAQRFLTLQQSATRGPNETTTSTTTAAAATKSLPPLFSQFFAYPQYTASHVPNMHTFKTDTTIADIEVTLIETHANIRILSRRRLRQLSKLISGFQTLYFTILHVSVTTLEPLVLYSISAKVEEGCQFNTADDIAGAVNHMLRIIEEEAILHV